MKRLGSFASRLFDMYSPVRSFLTHLSWVLAVVIAALYLGIYYRNDKLLLQGVRDQASSALDFIVKTRTWNSGYGAVYVEKQTGVETNPYIGKLGIEPDIEAIDGRVFTMRNPAMMTRELSNLFESGEGLQFKITSLKPVNPENRPDRFEESALRKFEQGVQEVWEVEKKNGSSHFRFMKPLLIEAPCLKCHSVTGYKVGEIRGGISISIPFTPLEKQMKINRWIFLLLSLVTISLVLWALYYMAGQMVNQLQIAQEQLREASITDPLTGMKNRRFIMERLEDEFQRSQRLMTPLGLIMIDIDHFKSINDTYGHLFGDYVLKAVAGLIVENKRIYDIAGRFGGEEFLIVAPEVLPEDIVNLAERIRVIIEQEVMEDKGNVVKVTISIGMAVMNSEDISSETLLSRADNALYKAKREGRNRVSMAC